MSTPDRIRTDELTPGARVIWDKDWTKFTVDSVTLAKLDWRFQGRQSDGSYSSESGMDVVGHNAKGERVEYLAAQSHLWWIDSAVEEPATGVAPQSAPKTHDPLVVNTQDGAVWWRRAVTREGRGLYAVADAPACCPEYVMATLSELAEHGLASMAFALPMPVGTAPQADADLAKAPWGRGEDGRPRLPMGAHWTDIPELVDGTVAKIQGRLDRATSGHWYDASLTEAWRAPGTVRTNVAGLQRTVGRVTDMSGADRELVLHAHDDLRWCLEMLARLRGQVAALLTERHTTNEGLSERDEALGVQRDRIAELEAAPRMVCRECAAPVQWVDHDNGGWWNHASPSVRDGHSIVPKPFVDPCHPCGCPKRFDRHADGCTTLAPREAEAAKAVCRCDEPGADPYACEADDCSGYFSELNPFGSGARPVHVPSAEVSRKCPCGWRTTVWHVDDGSAEEELHGHVVRVHGGVYPSAEEVEA